MAKASGTALIEQPDEESLGPAMLACIPDERRFVVALVETGGNWTNAAALAGYGAARHAATRLKSRPRVLEAIREHAESELRAGVIIATSALLEIASDPMSKQRFAASKEILDRAQVLLVETQHRVVVENRQTTKELIDFITKTALANGLDPKTLLGQNAVIDAEYVEVIRNPQDAYNEDDFTILPGEFSDDAATPEDHGVHTEQALRGGESRIESGGDVLAGGSDGG